MSPIYVVTCQCDDLYYPGHISEHNRAFTNKEEADAFVLNLNGDGEDAFTAQYGPYFYLTEVTLN